MKYIKIEDEGRWNELGALIREGMWSKPREERPKWIEELALKDYEELDEI